MQLGNAHTLLEGQHKLAVICFESAQHSLVDRYKVCCLLVAKLHVVAKHVDVEQLPDILLLVVLCNGRLDCSDETPLSPGQPSAKFVMVKSHMQLSVQGPRQARPIPDRQASHVAAPVKADSDAINPERSAVADSREHAGECL